jgi:hypothetical protein
MRKAPEITLSAEEREQLRKCANSRMSEARLVLRATIVLLAARGFDNLERQHGEADPGRDQSDLELAQVHAEAGPHLRRAADRSQRRSGRLDRDHRDRQRHGIKADELKQIWEKYKRSGNSRCAAVAQASASYIVKQIVEAHGGEISVASIEASARAWCRNCPWRAA